MKSAAFIVAALAFLLLGVQFFMRSAQTKAYKTGPGAIAPLQPDDYSAAKLYGGARPNTTTPPDSLAR